MSNLPDTFKKDYLSKDWNEYAKNVKVGDKVIAKRVLYEIWEVTRVLPTQIEAKNQKNVLIKFLRDGGKEVGTSWADEQYVYPLTTENQRRIDVANARIASYEHHSQQIRALYALSTKIHSIAQDNKRVPERAEALEALAKDIREAISKFEAT